MNQERQLQYYAKIAGALQELFNSDGQYQIDLKDFSDDSEALNDFFHCLATRVPQMVFAKITGQELDPLQFNHIANRLILQDATSKNKAQTD